MYKQNMFERHSRVNQFTCMGTTKVYCCVSRDRSGLQQKKALKKAPFQGKKSTFLAKKAPILQTKNTFGAEKSTW